MLLNKYNPSKIIITGHSLGGALSSLCALDLTLNPISANQPQITAVTFGSPKVGDEEFAKLYNSSIPSCYRMILKYDGIPLLPPSIPRLSYRHVGKRVVMREPDNDDIFELTWAGCHHYVHYLEATKARVKNTFEKSINWPKIWYALVRPFLYFGHFHIFDLFCTSTH